MAPNRGRNRQRDFDDILQNNSRDFDPEQDDVAQPSDDEIDVEQSDDNDFDGREHYINVDKSKLRQPKAVPLGPQYRGATVDRNALAEVEEDDPFNRSFDETGSESGGSAARGRRHSATNDGEASDSNDEDMENATDATDISEDDAQWEVQDEQSTKDSALREELKNIKNKDAQRSLAKSLSQVSREDAEKGRAVKRQRTTFDALLNTRMKLQKSLISANTLVGITRETIDVQRDEARTAFEAAEAAAFKLWESLNSFREQLAVGEGGAKRKRSEFSLASSTEELWEHVRAQELENVQQREAVLKKWSVKAQGPAVQTQSRINQTEHQATIIDVLHEQLSNSDRLLQRAHAPRSCAPFQLSQRINEDERIYDDADFYGLLLKELLEQKSQDSVAASNIDIGFQMRREAKTKRNVDTKASKGRKLRYTVHEKLQNFMAPEDRTTWGERQADGLFASLFGQGMALAENDEQEQVDSVNEEEAGLMLFRS